MFICRVCMYSRESARRHVTGAQPRPRRTDRAAKWGTGGLGGRRESLEWKKRWKAQAGMGILDWQARPADPEPRPIGCHVPG